MTQPRTCSQEQIAELEEKRSRFLAHLIPFTTLESRLDHLKTEHQKANHFVIAARWYDSDGYIQTSAKDDGEPSGTSGMPILKVIMGADLLDTAVVCVRYFGGTKLGTGGLARAYGGAARQAIEAAENNGRIVNWDTISRLMLELNFSKASQVEKRVPNSQVKIIDRQFGVDTVRLVLEGPSRELRQFDPKAL